MRLLIISALLLSSLNTYCWGFFGHRQINYYAVFLLPPSMLSFYKPNIHYLQEHSVDPDKRRYAISEEGPRHYIDLDHYGTYPFDDLPRKYGDAVARYSKDSIEAHGVAPWWIQTMLYRLTASFKEKDYARVLKLSAEIAHYVADIHVPLHTSSNHNGQKSNQHGIHGFWESRVPELLADTEWDFFIGKCEYIEDPSAFIWNRVLESAKAVDSVLSFEKILTQQVAADKKFAHEERNGLLTRQYSSYFTRKYDRMLNGMVERRMRTAIYSVASIWYTAWVNAGQPQLTNTSIESSEAEKKELDSLEKTWRLGKSVARPCDE